MSKELRGLGCIPSPKDVRDYRIQVATAQQFPEEFELKTVTVKNQGQVGSCVAHSLSEVVEYFNKIQHSSTAKMSTGYIYGNRRDSVWENEGMITRDALKSLTKYGDVTYQEFPYNVEVPEAIELFESNSESLFNKGTPHRISSYFRVRTEDEIKSALTKYGPVVFSIQWYNDIKVVDGKITTTFDSNKKSGYHCMIIYGWNKDGWLIQNSWGTGWGTKGRAILPYSFPLQEAWGVIDNILETTDDIVKPYSNPVLKVIAKVINFFYNLFNKKN